MNVPFLDLKANYKSIKPEVDAAIQEVIDNTAFALGFAVDKLEKNFAEYVGVKHAIACNSGTSALHLALIAAGVGEGDEVILTPSTFVSTSWAVSYVRATPVFVDTDEETYTIDVSKIEEKITDKTKAIIPVHLYGQSADMNPILEIAKKHGIKVIEDASQAHGSRYNEKSCGSMGDAGCFSFYPGKNMGAYGEGGMVTTNCDDMAEKMRLYRNHCQPEKYYHDDIGYNYRMDGIQGAVLDVKLRHIENWNDMRRTNAKKYTEGLTEIKEVKTPPLKDYMTPVWHLYEVMTDSKETRDKLLKFLHDNGVGAGLHYPIPLHLQKAYAHLGYKKGDFPVVEKMADQLISLPMYPEMTEEMINYTVEKVKEFYK
jgi:dTDP-4-amino-4,6-dideoxygalactose transaminase